MKQGQQLILVFLVVSLFCTAAQGQRKSCEVPDVGSMELGKIKTKASLVHIWQGAVGGVKTNNADRINGLYDFDLFYLLSAEQTEDLKGDYTLLNVSTRAAFGNGLSTSKVDSFFEINDAAKGDISGQIDKLFVEFTVLDRLFTFDIGKIDLDDYFDTSAVANSYKSQFFAEPFKNNTTIPFSSNGLGIRVLWEPGDFWYAQAAIADAQADKRETGFNTTFSDEDYFFSIAEIGIRPKFFDKEGTYRFIIWYDPQDKSYLDGSGHTKRDDLGFAVSFDQKLSQKITGFFRYGWADDKVNETENFVSFGAQIKGLIEARPKDIFAVGYANALRSPEGLSAGDERQIDLVEAYYKIRVNDNISITPNIQFVMDPGGSKNESPATVFGLRCRIKF